MVSLVDKTVLLDKDQVRQSVFTVWLNGLLIFQTDAFLWF